MRLWTLHPRYLDPQGLVALWREALLAQAVLRGRTRGYTHHPQLARFRSSGTPGGSIAAYLRVVHEEATRRGYRFDAKKIARGSRVKSISATKGQLAYEWKHLRAKLRRRAPSWMATLKPRSLPAPHPLFRIIPGGVAEWEVIKPDKPANLTLRRHRVR
ncbi:MAG TPA: pyrimidine dimer DNA glycosylase/endonuclease V [Gammaproteobacteria bacterium]|nr:pyrimidine dimer DNA glycosylase/endonuclease V [Gammaproteobacteria bacterium]